MKNTKEQTYTPLSSKIHSVFLKTNSRPRPWLFVVLILYALYVVASWALLPSFVHNHLSAFLLQDLQGKASFERISYNPFTLTFTLHNFQVQYPETENIFITAEGVSLAPGLLSLAKLTPGLGHLRIVNPVVNLSLSKNAEFSPMQFTRFFAEKAESKTPPTQNTLPTEQTLAKPQNSVEQDGASKESVVPTSLTGQNDNEQTTAEKTTLTLTEQETLFPFTISNLSIINGTINFEDDLHQTNLQVENLNISVPFASTRLQDKTRKVRPTLSAKVNGQNIEIEGQIAPFAEDMQAEFLLRTQEFALQKLQPYFETYTLLQVVSGTARTKLSLNFANFQGQTNMGLSGELLLEDVLLSLKDNTEVLALPYGKLELKHMLLSLDELTVTELSLTEPRFYLAREQNNRINWQLYLKNLPEQKKETSVEGTHPLQMPNIFLQKLWVKDAELNWQDNTLKKTSGFKLNPINLEARNISTKGAGVGEFMLALGDYRIIPLVSKPQEQTHNTEQGVPSNNSSSLPKTENTQDSGNLAKETAIPSQDLILDSNLAHLKRRLEVSGEENSVGQVAIIGNIAHQTFNTQAEFLVNNLPINIANPYLEPFGLSIQNGLLQSDLQLQIKEPFTAPVLVMQQGSIALKDFFAKYLAKDSTSIEVKTENLATENIELSASSASFGKILLERPSIKVAMPKENLNNAETPKPAANLAKNTLKKQEDFIFNLQSLQVKKGTISVTHQSAPETPLLLEDVEAEVNNFSSNAGVALNTKASAKWNKTGVTTTTGSGTITPLNIVLSSEFKDIPVVSFSPWLKKFSSAEITSGSINGDLTTNIAEAGIAVKAALNPEQEKKAKAAREKYAKNRKTYEQLSVASELGVGFALAGKATADNLVIKDDSRDILNVQRARLFGLNLNTAAGTYDIGRISLTNPKFAISIFPDGTNSISRALNISSTKPAGNQNADTKNTPKAPATQNTTQGSKPILESIYRLTLNSMKIENGQVRLLDNTFKTRSILTLSNLNVAMENLTTLEGEAAKFNITGLLEGANLTLTGEGQPLRLPLTGNMEVVLQDMDMRPLSPYAERFLSHPIEKGVVYLNTKLETDGDNITGKIRLKTYNLALGKKVDSTEAINQPIKLGLSLLADRSGTIALTIPVNGKLSDPDFRTGAIIGKGFRNLIGKVITSPFSLLGSLVGGGEKQTNLQYITFARGDYRVQGANIDTVKQIADLLESKKNLSLVLQGIVYQNEREYLAQSFITQGVQDIMWNKLPKKERLQTTAADLAIDMESAEFKELVLEFYKNLKLKNAPTAKAMQKETTQKIISIISQNVDKSDDALEKLAQQRASSVLEEFLKINPQLEGRIKIAPVPSFRDDKDATSIVGVEFGLAEQLAEKK